MTFDYQTMPEVERLAERRERVRPLLKRLIAAHDEDAALDVLVMWLTVVAEAERGACAAEVERVAATYPLNERTALEAVAMMVRHSPTAAGVAKVPNPRDL